MSIVYDVVWVEKFRDYLLQLGYSHTSVKSLPAYIRVFLVRFLKPGLQNSVQHISRADILMFYKELQERPSQKSAGGLSESYIYKHIYVLRLFFSFLETGGYIRSNPISALKFKPPHSDSREPLSRSEIALLFEQAQTLREKAILHLFYSCGLRRSEAVSLNIRDVHFKSGLLYVREGKGGKRRVLPLTKTVSDTLKHYYLQERQVGLSSQADTEAFILNRYGSRMSCAAFNKFMRKFVLRTGLERIVSPHYLRHSIATHLLENGLSLEYVREFLGHSFLESTQIYTKISKTQLHKL